MNEECYKYAYKSRSSSFYTILSSYYMYYTYIGFASTFMKHTLKVYFVLLLKNIK